MDADTAPATKGALRRDLLRRRRELGVAELARSSAVVVASLRALPELAPRAREGPATLLLYAATPDELDLSALLAAPPAGWRTALPRVDGELLEVVLHRPGDPLVIGMLGTSEPSGVALPPDAVDVVVLPGVAFDTTLRRLGRGGGHYDRLLAALRPDAVTVGVSPEALVVPDAPGLPQEPHDRPVDVLVTDASVRRRVVGPAVPATGEDA